MFHRWLDERDERRARRADEEKEVTDLVLDADLAFPTNKSVVNTAEFCTLAEQDTADSAAFYGLEGQGSEATWKGGWITFPSSLSTDIAENNTVRATVSYTHLTLPTNREV